MSYKSNRRDTGKIWYALDLKHIKRLKCAYFRVIHSTNSFILSVYSIFPLHQCGQLCIWCRYLHETKIERSSIPILNIMLRNQTLLLSFQQYIYNCHFSIFQRHFLNKTFSVTNHLHYLQSIKEKGARRCVCLAIILYVRLAIGYYHTKRSVNGHFTFQRDSKRYRVF